jgi:hypothetical protein
MIGDQTRSGAPGSHTRSLKSLPPIPITPAALAVPVSFLTAYR